MVALCAFLYWSGFIRRDELHRFSPDKFHKFRLISDGIEMGQAAKPLFAVKWEEGLERPLEEWRQELNIKPVMEGPYSWYSNPKLRAALEI